MRIRIDPHTLERAAERGATRSEIEEVLTAGIPVPAKQSRLAKTKVFSFRRVWRGRYYEQKKVEVIYTEESDVVATVTVYVFYGSWET
jgi:hypothetical protein